MYSVIATYMLVFLCGTLFCCDASRPNVLFLVADDMRPQLGCYYGQDFPVPVYPTMITPNLDYLASQSLLLRKAYVQVALCSPSRTSLLTGRRPDTTRIWTIGPYFRKKGGNFTTIPQYFKENGYKSVGMGKIFHPGQSSDYDDPISWSVPYYHPPNYDYWNTKNISWLAVPRKKQEKRPLGDTQLAGHAIKTLRELAPGAINGKTPFFLAVGFRRPHLPFVFPEEYLDLYPAESIKLPENPYAPVDMPDLAWYNYGGLRGYKDIEALHASGKINTTLPDKVVLDLRRAYYSALTYTDDMLGTVMAELDKLGLTKNTIVSFWGDHGYQLGEHAEWCKQTNFELATHAPMMVRIPGKTDGGLVTEQLTEFVDLFPTLVEAAGLPPMPICPTNSSKILVCREGQSLMPLLDTSNADQWKNKVFSQYQRNGKYMGYTMRTDQYRYTEWVKFNFDKAAPIWDDLHGVELYIHDIDPQENINYAKYPEYHDLTDKLSAELHAGWRDVIN